VRSISAVFASLRAPLVNQRWSWGAQRPTDGAVFLRVWQDLKFMRNGDSFFVVDARLKDDQHSTGYQERVRHLDTVRQGAPCYLVMCSVKDVNASPRVIADFNDSEVFVGAELIETSADFDFPGGTAQHVRALATEGATWIKRGRRIPIAEIAP
jgi:hypothetical protein